MRVHSKYKYTEPTVSDRDDLAEAPERMRNARIVPARRAWVLLCAGLIVLW